MNWLKRVYKELLWSFVFSVLLAIVFGIVYISINKNKPSLSFEITNEANVLDIRKPLKDLNIVFQGEDIQEKNLNLRILTIRIGNIGNVDILQNYYDSDDIWGFKVENGKIIEVRWIKSNSEYLKSNLNPHLFTGDTVQFKKAIFEKRKYFTLEILVLHTKTILPKIIPLGKIAGIERIVAVKTWEKKEPGFLEKLFSGNALIQIFRFIIYPISALIFVISSGLVAGKINTFLKERKKETRRKDIERLKYIGLKVPKRGIKKKLLEIYINQGLKALKELKIILADEIDVLREMAKYKLYEDITKHELRSRRMPEVEIAVLLNDLKKKNIIKLEPKKTYIDPSLKRALNEVLRLLEPEKKKQTK